MLNRLIEILEQMSCCYYENCDQEDCAECGRMEIYDSDIKKIADHLIAKGVIVPPVNVGDMVYVIDNKTNCYSCNFFEEFCDKNCFVEDKTKPTVKSATIVRIELTEKSKEFIVEVKATLATRSYLRTYMFSDFGKTIFLTREEAEQAKERGE